MERAFARLETRRCASVERELQPPQPGSSVFRLCVLLRQRVEAEIAPTFPPRLLPGLVAWGALGHGAHGMVISWDLYAFW